MAIDVEQIEAKVREWFEKVGAASMELPDGWFGRPYDNQHRLTWAVVRDSKLIVELDEQVHLILSEVAGLEEDDRALIVVTGRLVLDRREYGSSGRRETRVYENGGPVTFHP